MPKAVILFNFKRGDTSPLIENLTKLQFNRTDGHRTIFSKEFSLDEVELDLKQLKTIKKSITKNATILIASPSRVWREAFKAAGLDSEEAIMLAGLAMSEPPVTKTADMSDSGAVAGPVGEEEGIVGDDFDLDALIAGLANTKIGGRRKTRKQRRMSRRAH